ncbi:MAG: hypothetical protein KKB13_18820 [Chloroflexi bacterium]|nr:hypothetical protein [Chloroflexota bacterium]
MTPTIPVTDKLIIECHPDDTGFYNAPFLWLRRTDGQTDGVIYLDEVRPLLEALARAAAETAGEAVLSAQIAEGADR